MHTHAAGHRGFTGTALNRSWSWNGERQGHLVSQDNLQFLIFHNSSHMPALDNARGMYAMLDAFLEDVDVTASALESQEPAPVRGGGCWAPSYSREAGQGAG